MTSSSTARREALQARHQAISHKIEMEQARPGANDWLITSLKRQRLFLKDEMEETGS